MHSFSLPRRDSTTDLSLSRWKKNIISALREIQLASRFTKTKGINLHSISKHARRNHLLFLCLLCTVYRIPPHLSICLYTVPFFPFVPSQIFRPLSPECCIHTYMYAFPPALLISDPIATSWPTYTLLPRSPHTFSNLFAVLYPQFNHSRPASLLGGGKNLAFFSLSQEGWPRPGLPTQHQNIDRVETQNSPFPVFIGQYRHYSKLILSGTTCSTKTMPSCGD